MIQLQTGRVGPVCGNRSDYMHYNLQKEIHTYYSSTVEVIIEVEMY